MTHYDRLVDTISAHLYDSFCEKEWNQAIADERSRKILEAVEEFQNTRSKVTKWRATD